MEYFGQKKYIKQVISSKNKNFLIMKTELNLDFPFFNFGFSFLSNNSFSENI